MPKSLRDTLEVWHLIVGGVLQTVVMIVFASVWVTNSNRDHVDFRRDILADQTRMIAMQIQIDRIDNDGSMVWKLSRPSDVRASDRNESRLFSIESKVGGLSEQVAKLVVLAEQNQKMLKDK